MKIGIITQARMTSTRLPGKVLQKIANKTLLEYHIERAQQAGFPVVIATSTDHTDDAIEQLCQIKQWQYFRGDLENVLSRYYHAAQTYHFETIVRITSDCPFIDGQLIKEGYQIFKDTHCEYLSNTVHRTYPRGFDFEIMTSSALEKAYLHATEDFEKEHVTPYIWKTHPDQFRIEQFTQRKDYSDFRITVDTKEDFEVIQQLIEDYHADKMRYNEIIQLLIDHPEIVAINKNVEQKPV